MTGALAGLLAVMLLADPTEVIDAAAAAAVSEDADRVERVGRTAEVTRARVTSRASDFDRLEGVAMFEGDVVVTYSDDYTMCADRLYMFMSKSNEMSRVVAVGNVSITNDTRVGTCAMATYRRRRGEIEMFGDGATLARLVENGEEASAVAGRRIRFWLDAEQVEIEDSRIDVQTKGAKAL